MCGICIICQFHQSHPFCSPVNRPPAVPEDHSIHRDLNLHQFSQDPLNYDVIARRGPDATRSGVVCFGEGPHHQSVDSSSESGGVGGGGRFVAEWMQSVLRMRTGGEDTVLEEERTYDLKNGTPTPGTGCHENFLLYNGEIYEGLDEEADSDSLRRLSNPSPAIHGEDDTDMQHRISDNSSDEKNSSVNHQNSRIADIVSTTVIPESSCDAGIGDEIDERTDPCGMMISGQCQCWSPVDPDGDCCSRLGDQDPAGCNCYNDQCTDDSSFNPMTHSSRDHNAARSKRRCDVTLSSRCLPRMSDTEIFSDLLEDVRDADDSSFNQMTQSALEHNVAKPQPRSDVTQSRRCRQRMSDTRLLTDLLKDARDADDVMRVIRRLKGPFAMIIVQPASSRLWFLVDLFGRRSLLASVRVGNPAGLPTQLILSSTAICDNSRQVELGDFMAVPSGVLFCVQFGSSGRRDSLKLTGYPFRQFPEGLTEFCVPFLDAELDERFVGQSRQPNPERSSLFQIFAGQESDLPVFNVTAEDDRATLMDSLLRAKHGLVVQFLCHLRRAVNRRIAEWTTPPGDSVAVLFSGGVDSLLITALIGQLLSPHRSVQLINVVFYEDEAGERANGKQAGVNKGRGQCKREPPDRLTGRAAFDELITIFPPGSCCKFEFVSVDVPASRVAEVERARMEVLLTPGHTGIIDRSLGVCLWFAAFGNGSFPGAHLNEEGLDTNSPRAKALLTGAGADELLGGYARHRSRFTAGGRQAVIRELEMEVRRIGARNLARDDRIVADHGREVRTPFLDEDFVRFVNGLVLEHKCDFSLPPGVGEKLILRLALWQLGFRMVALAPKRAFQFGSGVAKLQRLKP